jgi:hypothetical protein
MYSKTQISRRNIMNKKLVIGIGAGALFLIVTATATGVKLFSDRKAAADKGMTIKEYHKAQKAEAEEKKTQKAPSKGKENAAESAA